MKKIKAVIGANWGDEGKGLMTDYFCSQAYLNNEKCIVICSNGGAQRGHTVITPNNLRHVFHHYGAGSFVHADTFLPKEYIVNPMTFVKEWEELNALGITPKVYMHPDCIWTTPFDMIINQIFEESRQNKCGSCGMGIWETVLRHNYVDDYFNPIKTVSELSNITINNLRNTLKILRNEYISHRLSQENFIIPKHWHDIIYSDKLIEHFINDIFFMFEHAIIADEEILNQYDTVIFENGQGLMLDEKNEPNILNSTPSNTGIENIYNLTENIADDVNVEVCYVSRTYATRHGIGLFNNECNVSLLNPHIFDKTNVFNKFQGNIRYAPLNYSQMLKRIEQDFNSRKKKHNDWNLSLAMTHVNELPFNCNNDLSKINNLYTSNNVTRESVVKFY